MLIKTTRILNVSRYANDNGNFVLAVHWLAVPNLKNRPRTRTRIARAFGSGTKVYDLALGESALELRPVHGFGFEFEFEWDDADVSAEALTEAVPPMKTRKFDLRAD